MSNYVSPPPPEEWTGLGIPSRWMMPIGYILVVEDDPALRDVVCEALDDAGYGVLRAADGQEALQLLRLYPTITLVFLDLVLPKLTGWELKREMAADEDLRRIPVVMMTALPRPPDASDWLGKPFGIGRLLQLAEKHVGPAR